MYWISSSGGPLVILPREQLSIWLGSAGGGSDYNLACSVNDYAGVVKWRNQDVLVLGDEPLQTAMSVTSRGVVFIRWMYAPDEASIIKCMDPDEWGAPAEEVEWVIKSAEHVLFDSAARGSLVQDWIDVPLRAGRYRVTTYVVRPSRDVGGVVCDICAR